MNTNKRRSSVPTLFCALIFTVAIVLIHPVVETGILDDWSIVRTAQLLGQTGSIQYNGWEAPILGWPLYAAALMFKFFGFSFTAARASIMLTALGGVVLFQRLLIRFGIGTWLATFGALTMGLSPVFLMSSILFMTDVPGMVAVLCCIYCSVRAIQSPDDSTSVWWLVLAVSSNAVLGTARQISWLGLIVIVPATLWLLKRRSRVLIAGGIAWLSGLAFLGLVMFWFNHQPYVLPEHLLLGKLAIGPLLHGASSAVVRVILDLVLLAVPVPMLFWAFAVREVRQSARKLACVFGLFLMLVFALRAHWLPSRSLAPFLLFPSEPQSAENTFLSIQMPIHGVSPAPFEYTTRAVMTMLVFAGLAAVLLALPNLRHMPTQLPERSQASAGLSWPQTLALLVPFAVGYLILLLPRAIFIYTVDRYVLFLLPIGILVLLKLVSEASDRKPMLVGIASLSIVGFYSVFTLHDVFATYRAALLATQELQAAGVPREAISAGMEYNHWTELQHSTHIPNPGVRLPDGSTDPGRPDLEQQGPCMQTQSGQTPSIHPLYAVAYPGTGCEIANEFAPIPYTTWIPPFHRSAVIVHYRAGPVPHR